MLLTIRSLTGGIQKKIRLATSPNRGAIIYSRIYQPFSRRYPDTALELTELYSQEQAKAIRRSQIDLALGNGEFSTQVTDLPFAREEVLAVLPRSHPLSREHAVRLTELRDTPFVLQSAENSLRHRADTLFAEAGYLPVVVFESGDVHLLDAMMQQGAGAGLCKPCLCGSLRTAGLSVPDPARLPDTASALSAGPHPQRSRTLSRFSADPGTPV